MFIRFILLLVCCSVAAFAQSSPNVRVTWIGQSGFLIQTENGAAVVSDPPPANFGFLFPTTLVDAVTVSHTHNDHAGLGQAQGAAVLVDGRNVTERREQTVANTQFTIIPGFHDATGTTRNSLITWTQGGIKFMQGGDYGQANLTDTQLNDLQDVDVAFIAGANPVWTPPTAKNFIDQLKARVTILCHYRTPLGGAATLLPFKEMSAPYPRVVFKPSDVTINKDNLPTEPEIWVMQPRANAAVVNGASFASGQPVAPLSLVSVFGNFTNATTATAQSFPLPTMLGNVEVLVGGRAAPLLYVSPLQINFQVSGKLELSTQALVEVKVAGTTVGRAQLTVMTATPGIFVATDANYRHVTATTPIKRGEPMIIWATGYGELTEAVEDGQSTSGGLNPTKAMPRVTIGGIEAEVLFSGAAPGLAGVWQINVRVPNDTSVGTDVPVVVTQGFSSNVLALNVSAASFAEEQTSNHFWQTLRNWLSWS